MKKLTNPKKNAKTSIKEKKSLKNLNQLMQIWKH
jgi:hypothetical protein